MRVSTGQPVDKYNQVKHYRLIDVVVDEGVMETSWNPIAPLPTTRFERVEYRKDLAVPLPGADEVVVNVHAAGTNNTDINIRTGWYHQSVS
jgi:hypothetical protein